MRETADPFLDSSLPGALVPAPLGVYANLAYHLFPPISPMRQSSPREYFLSHAVKSSLLSLFIVVDPSYFSQTRIASGVSLRASTRMSDCVVTISCVRCDASTKSSARVGRISGCNPSSGSSMQTNGGGEGWQRIDSKERYRRCAIGKSCRGNGLI